jgi:serine/threonine protein kinase
MNYTNEIIIWSFELLLCIFFFILGRYYKELHNLYKLYKLQTTINTNYSLCNLNNIIQEHNYIGSGADAAVFEGTWGKEICAIKKINIEKSDEGISQKILLNEISFLTDINKHEHIVNYFGCILSPYHNIIILEYLKNGSVFDLLHSKNKISNKLKARILYDASKGLEYLHFKNIIHGDFAARNLLINDKWRIKISDFGLSRRIESGIINKTESDIGPIRWMPVETIKHRIFTNKTDIYSFGVVIYEIYSRKIPWGNLKLIDIIINISNGAILELPNNSPDFMKNLLQKCCKYNMNERPTINEINIELMDFTTKIFEKKI